MNRPAQRLATYEDLIDLPEHLIVEILHGQLITQPIPAPRHAFSSSGIAAELTLPFQRGRGGPGGWWILDEPELHLGSHILVPDLAGWRRERMPVFPETDYFTLAPDWVCEVLSPVTARTDRVVKTPIYATQGVAWLWLVDPDQRTLEVYRLLEGHWLLEQTAQEDDSVAPPPFDEHQFSLTDLWVPTSQQAPS